MVGEQEKTKKIVIKTALIGEPVAHSKSPLIHRYWIEKYGLNGQYEAIGCAPAALEDKIAALAAEGYAGFNVTVPHKRAVMRLCHDLDPVAQSVGAVNTVVINDGRLKGFNTDVFGFVENIKSGAKDFDFSSGPAVVLGAGGAARAVICGLLAEGAPRVIVTNRTREAAESLKEDFSRPGQRELPGRKIDIISWDERNNCLANANILVNATSLGMAGCPALEIDLTQLPRQALVNDIVYTPLMTGLLKAAKSNENRYVTGIGMLLHQARPAFEKWFGVLPDVTRELESLILDETK